MFIYELKPVRIRNRRKELKLSLRDLADKAGINHTTISRAENGDREPNATQLGILAGALDVTPDYFYKKVKKS